jgi:hypothetical protein
MVAWTRGLNNGEEGSQWGERLFLLSIFWADRFPARPVSLLEFP